MLSLFANITIASCIVLAAVCSTPAAAQQRIETPYVSLETPAGSKFDLLNPVALLSQAIASLIGPDARQSMLGDGRYVASLIERNRQNDLAVRFAADPEASRVSLLLAESQVRVQLAQDLQLRCEVSSQDEANTDAELKLDLGVQFKFK